MIASVILVLVAPSLIAQDLSQAQDHSKLGLSLAREGKLPEAEQELRKAVQIAPGVALPRAQLASILGLQGKWQEALESFQKAVDLEPTNINFRRETAAVQYQLRQIAEAEKNLHYVLAKHPDDRAILLLGLVSEAKGDYVTAARLLESQFPLVISQPDRTVALFHSDFQSDQRSNLPKIVEALRTRASDAAWADAISRCAQIAARGGDLATAETLFSFISANPAARSDTGVDLAKLRYRRGHVEAAQELVSQLASVIEWDPSRPEQYEDLIFLQLELGRTSDAVSLTNRLIALAPGDARAWVLKANVELRSNAFQDALQSYSHARSLDPSNADAVLGVASIQALSGSSDTAMAEYKAGIERFPNDPRFSIAFATALLSSPEAPQAYPQIKGLLLKAVKLDPHSPDAHYQLGQLALRQGQLSEAKREFLASLDANANRNSTHFALSLTYRRLGQADDAAKHFAIYERLKQSEEPGTPMSTQAATKP